MNVVFFGDSIMFAQCVSPHHGWVTRLSALVEERFADRFVVQNASVNGNTTRQALERMAYDVQAHEPVLLVVQFGLNDCNRWPTDRGLPRVSSAAFAANLTEIVERGRAFGAQRVVLCTNHPTTKGGGYDEDNRSYNAQIRAIAGGRDDTALLDFERSFDDAVADSLAELLLPDGIHLSEAGHDAYLGAAAGPILAELERIAAR